MIVLYVSILIYFIIKKIFFGRKKKEISNGFESSFNPENNINHTLLMKNESENKSDQVSLIAEALNNMNFSFKEYTEENGNVVYNFPVKTNQMMTSVTVKNRLKEKTISMVITLPVFAPELNRPAVFEFIGMINYGYHIGVFEQDHRDGEIRLRSEIPFNDRFQLTAEKICKWLNDTIGLLDHTFPSFISIAFNNAVPEDIWQRLRDGVNPRLN